MLLKNENAVYIKDVESEIITERISGENHGGEKTNEEELATGLAENETKGA